MLFVVAAALVDVDGRVLLTQRPEGKPMAGLWEFPGGKVKPDEETPEEALCRELKEELAIRTAPCCIWPLSFVTYPLSDTGQPDKNFDAPAVAASANDAGDMGCNPLAPFPAFDPDDMLLMLLYLCRRWDGLPQPMEGQAMKWVKPSELADYPMPPADVPLVRVIQDNI